MHKNTIISLSIAILFLSLLALYLRTEVLSSGTPLDDTYIHFQYAEKLANYGGFYYNIGDPETGATSPLWVIILAGAYLIIGIKLAYAAKILGILFHLASTYIIFLLLKENIKNEWFIWLGVSFFLFSPSLFFYSLSGMEVSLAAFLYLMTFYFFIHNKPIHTGVALGLSMLARPEGLILFGFLAVASILKRHYNKEDLREIAITLIIAIILVAPWITYCFQLTGNVFPSTLQAKVPTLIIWAPGIISIVLWPLYEIQVSVLALIIVYAIGAYKLLQNDSIKYSLIAFPLVYIIPICLIIGMVPIFATTLTRYCAPIIGIALFFFMCGIEHICIEWQGRKREYILALITVLFMWSLINTILLSRQYESDTKSIIDMQVTMAKWVDTNVPIGANIGINDAGAVMYHSTPKSNHTFIDLMGLNTNKVISIGSYQAVNEYNLTYLVIYDEWFPKMKQYYDLHEIYNITVSQNTVSAQNTVHVYKVLGQKQNITN